MTSKMFYEILGNSLKFVNGIRTKEDEKETKKKDKFFLDANEAKRDWNLVTR